MDISKGNIEILQSGYYEITGETDINNIYVKAQATIVLDNVTIDLNKKNISKGAIIIDKSSDVTLIIKNKNVLKSGYNYAGIQLIGRSKLTIREDTLLNQYNELYIQSGETAAGIGSGFGGDYLGDIIIENGNIVIVSLRDGAGIGGGNGLNGGGDFIGSLTISGGNINITQGYGGGAGIGGGSNGSLVGRVEVNNGILLSNVDEAGIGAGIGGGYNGNFEGTVIINGGNITSVGGEGCAGIGAGIGNTIRGNFTGEVKINGGNVVAIGGVYDTYGGGAGIGSGFKGDFSGEIKLNAGFIEARGGSTGSDFGSGTGGESVGDITAKVKSIDVIPDFLDLQIGESEKVVSQVTLVATVQGSLPDYSKVTYTSRDTNIAVVDSSGLVTAVDNGNTEIIVTSVIDKNKFTICYVSVNSSITIIGDIDLLISIPKNEIQPSELYNIVCYGNNPIITYKYKDSCIKEFDVYVNVPCCKNPVLGKGQYKNIVVCITVDYSIALYSGSDCLQNLLIYALEFDNFSTNLNFCTSINEDIDTSKFKIIIMPYYELDTNYSQKYYMFKIRGHIGLYKIM